MSWLRLGALAEAALADYLVKVTDRLPHINDHTLRYVHESVSNPTLDRGRWMVLRLMDHTMEKYGVSVGERFAFMTDPGVYRSWLARLRCVVNGEIDRRTRAGWKGR